MLTDVMSDIRLLEPLLYPLRIRIDDA